MDIVVSVNNNEKVMVLPVIPENMPELVQAYKNEVFDTVDGEINLIGTKGLCEVTLQSFFPVNKSYRFIRPGSVADGHKYVDFFHECADSRRPIRMIWIDGMRELLNMPFTVESVAFTINKVRDIEYAVELREYRLISSGRVV